MPSDAGPDAAIIPTLAPTEAAACERSQQFSYQPIANFDLGFPTWLAIPGAVYVSSDLTGPLYLDANGSTTPVPGLSAISCVTGYNPSTPDPPPQKRCGSDNGTLRLHATELSNWGMNASIDLRQNCAGTNSPGTGASVNPCFFNATNWTGVSFWALRGSRSTGVAALLSVGDPNSSGQLGGNVTPFRTPEGNYPFNQLTCGNAPCVMNAPPDNRCTSTSVPLCLCDPYSKAVALVDHWEFYAIPFSEMRQKGYGLSEAALDLAHILSLKLSLGKGDWDVWIDDVAFYKPKGP